jgi:hypothetical protein
MLVSLDQECDSTEVGNQRSGDEGEFSEYGAHVGWEPSKVRESPASRSVICTVGGPGNVRPLNYI